MSDRSRVSYSHDLRDEAKRKAYSLATIDLDQPDGTRITVQAVVGPETQAELKRLVERIARRRSVPIGDVVAGALELSSDGATA